MSTRPSRSFHLGDVLSVTTGFLVAPSGMQAMYDLLEPLAEVDHTRIDPLTELASMVGRDRVIAVAIETGDGEVSS
jgi:hypothetical protein